MRITKKHVPFTDRVQLSDTVLEEVKEFKDLGILPPLAGMKHTYVRLAIVIFSHF